MKDLETVKYMVIAAKESPSITIRQPLREFDAKLAADKYLEAFRLSEAGKELVDDGFTLYLTRETTTKNIEHLRSISR